MTLARLAPVLASSLLALWLLAAPGLVTAQDVEGAQAPRTVASQLVVDAIRASMEDRAAESAAPAETSTGPVAASVPLSTRVSWARAGIARTGRQISFETGRLLRAGRRVSAPTLRAVGRELGTPVGAAGAIVVFAILLGTAILYRRRRQEERADERPHRAARTREIADARSLIALGRSTTEVSARTGISQDIVATMRRLHYDVQPPEHPTMGAGRIA